MLVKRLKIMDDPLAIPQAINALHDKKGLTTWDFLVLCVQLLQMDREYCASLQTSILSINGVQMLMYTRKLCIKSHSREFFDCLDYEFLNWENFC